jgi:hypothetical protein
MHGAHLQPAPELRFAFPITSDFNLGWVWCWSFGFGN